MASPFQVDGDHAAAMMNMEGSLGQVEPTGPYAHKLWAVSSTTLVVDIGAWLHQPAAGSVLGDHKVAYYGILAGVLAVVAVEMATALWLTRSRGPRVRAFTKGLLPLAVLLLLAVVAAFGTALTVKA